MRLRERRLRPNKPPVRASNHSAPQCRQRTTQGLLSSSRVTEFCRGKVSSAFGPWSFEPHKRNWIADRSLGRRDKLAGTPRHVAGPPGSPSDSAIAGLWHSGTIRTRFGHGPRSRLSRPWQRSGANQRQWQALTRRAGECTKQGQRLPSVADPAFLPGGAHGHPIAINARAWRDASCPCTTQGREQIRPNVSNLGAGSARQGESRSCDAEQGFLRRAGDFWSILGLLVCLIPTRMIADAKATLSQAESSVAVRS